MIPTGDAVGIGHTLRLRHESKRRDLCSLIGRIIHTQLEAISKRDLATHYMNAENVSFLESWMGTEIV